MEGKLTRIEPVVPSWSLEITLTDRERALVRGWVGNTSTAEFKKYMKQPVTDREVSALTMALYQILDVPKGG